MIASIFTLCAAGARCLCSAPRRGFKRKKKNWEGRPRDRKRGEGWRNALGAGRCAAYLAVSWAVSQLNTFAYLGGCFFLFHSHCGKRPRSIPRSLTSPVASNMLVKMTVAFHFIIDTLPFRFCFRTSRTTVLLALLRRAPVALCASCLCDAVTLGAKRTCRKRGLTLAGPRCTSSPPGGQNHLSAVERRGWCGCDYRRDERGRGRGDIMHFRLQVAQYYLRYVAKTGYFLILYEYLFDNSTTSWKSVLFGIESQ